MKNELEGPGSGGSSDSEQAAKPFWTSVYKARGLGKVSSEDAFLVDTWWDSEGPGGAAPCPGDMASVQKP